MFGKGRINSTIQKTNYAPGDIIFGNVTLASKKPVKARELTMSLIGEQITTGRGSTMVGPGTSTTTGVGGGSVTTHRMRIYDFKQQLDSEKEYSQGREYRFEIKIPADIVGMGPQIPEVEGGLGRVLKTAQAAAAMTGAIPFRRIKWYLLAKLDIPGRLDIKKKVDLTIG